MNIVLGISGGALYALWKLLKYLFDNGYWAVAVVIIVIVVIYYWKKESDSVPSHLSHKKDSESKNVEDNEIIAEVYKPENTPKQIIGCLSCGKTLKKDRYRIFSYISHGGFGNTYLAEDTLLNKYVAIKELFVRDICARELQTEDVKISIETNRTTFEGLKKKFIKEAKRLQAFHCPNIIRVYDCFEENGTAYYSMDYIPGDSLASVLKQKSRLSEDYIRTLLPGLFNALSTVHNENIWHLDIKPANLMLRNSKSLVLIDFGASKQYEDKEGKTLTSSSAMAYTSGFAPPEQISNNTKNIGAWTDIYALGATLFNLLTGSKPPQTDEIISEGLPLFPSDVSNEMVKAVTAMMQPNRNARPQSINEVARLLSISIYEQ